MRHNIDRYADLNSDEFAGWMIGTGILAFIGLITLLICALPPTLMTGVYIAIGMVTPAAIHGTLAATHVNRGLGNSQSALLGTYSKLPKSVRGDIRLTRDEVLTLSSEECYAMREKMNEALTHFNRDYNGPVGRANSVLDSHITTYKELENMK